MTLRVVVAVAALLLSGSAAVAAPTDIVLDGHSPGGRFDGIGATSGGGATTRLLVDYPPARRAEILDNLFRPHFGASLQQLKVEIGSDGNSTEGAEPTHMRTADAVDCNRGYEWWLMSEAKRRNPAIRLGALAWNWPAWVGKPGSPQSADYLVAFVRCAAKHKLTLDTIGLWNESKMDPGFAPVLRAKLDAAGFTRTRIVADDLVNDWSIVDAMDHSPLVRDAIDIIATHYPRFASSAIARDRSARWNKPLWSTEDGPWSDNWGQGGEQSPPLAALINRNYVDGRMTSTSVWNLVTSYYDALELPNAGLMRANTPWSGGFEVTSPVWVVAHTTQFAQPGWRYIDRASGRLAKGGSHVALHSGAAWSLIVETNGATVPQRLSFAVTGGLATSAVHVWRSDAQRQFEKIATLRPTRGRFAFTVLPGNIYTFTTTVGQNKGVAPALATPERRFPMPWRDAFERAGFGRSPAWLSDLNGAFEMDRCPDRFGGCLVQRTTKVPIPWTYWRTMREVGALSVGGDVRWHNYRVSADVRLDRPGYASLIGRMSKLSSDGPLSAYQFRLDDVGNWTLLAATTEGIIASGKSAAIAGRWHHLDLVMRGERITGAIDGAQVVSITDARQARGLAGLGAGWNVAAFDNFEVAPLDADSAVIATEAVTAPIGRPEAPKLFVLEALDRAVHLTWSSVVGATGYRVRIGTKDGVWDKTVDVGVSTEQTFRTLTNGRTYWFQVVAVNGNGEGPGAGQFATPTGP